jgi:chromosome segregation protein
MDQDIKQTKQNIYNLTLELKNLEEKIKSDKEKRIALQELLGSLEKELKQKQTQIDQLKNDIYDRKTKLAKVEVEIKSGREKLKEQFGYEYDQALNYKIEIQNRRNVIKRINELKGYISDLGIVNFAAIAEHERVSQRLEFLTKQSSDLLEAKDSLGKVIKDMDQIMVKKFRETFNQVNEAFGSVFAKMFGGGRAQLVLSDADNLLETGIEIIVQPPGKKQQALSLLSGGERAMTAIALLFAILKVKPSPFCVLDEIEAALDEANVERFSAFLKHYVQKTQFIIISHRKGTMEAADVLYGVTIEEETGVSKLISVKLSEAV